MTAPGPNAPPVSIAVAVVQRDGLFLIGRRESGGPLAGYWEFPGGKIDPGETPTTAAARECQEETGLAVRVVGEYPTVEHEYAHGRLRLYFLACVVQTSTGPLPERFRWVPRAELGRYRFPPANARLVEQLTRREE